MLAPEKLREQLEARRAQLEAAIRNLEANLVANRGALQMCDEALAMLESEGDDAEPTDES